MAERAIGNLREEAEMRHSGMDEQQIKSNSFAAMLQRLDSKVKAEEKPSPQLEISKASAPEPETELAEGAIIDTAVMQHHLIVSSLATMEYLQRQFQLPREQEATATAVPAKETVLEASVLPPAKPPENKPTGTVKPTPLKTACDSPAGASKNTYTFPYASHIGGDRAAQRELYGQRGAPKTGDA